MVHLPTHSVALSSPRPHTSSPHHSHSGNSLRFPLNGQRDLMRNPDHLEIQASHRSSDFAHICNAGDGEHHPTQELAATVGTSHGSSFDTKGSYPQKQEQQWASDMDAYLAASRLCREEAMACLLQAAGIHWPFAEREKKRMKMQHKSKSLLGTCRALNAGTNKSWRGLKKLFSKQFMPFSNRDHHGLHHINITISKRSSKALNVGGGRKMDARIQHGASKSEAMLGLKKLHGKENIEQNANGFRESSGIRVEKCGSKRGGSCAKNWMSQKGKLKKGGVKKKLRILLRKTSGVALEVCDFLNLE